MVNFNLSPVETKFLDHSGRLAPVTHIPYLVVENFPMLGLLTSLRFLEWAIQYPDGVISLPTGKTPEHFITRTQKMLREWPTYEMNDLREKYGFKILQKPDLRGLHFVQIDEFYPIRPTQKNSFYDFVNTYYIDGFGLDRKKCLLMNCDDIRLAGDRHFSEVFPDLKVDLSLRYRECDNSRERIQQQSIFLIDEWCQQYEEKIRALGGLGFFLGGIGPDGHIAFNTRGSDHFSTTRLTSTNFETQAVAASDLGGIDISRNHAVITIGLSTITYNPDCTAIIIAAGEAKADVVRNALENSPSNLYPASVLGKLKNARFYLTRGAASSLHESVESYYSGTPWHPSKTERAVINLCTNINKYAHHLTADDLSNDEFARLIPDPFPYSVDQVIGAAKKKLTQGTQSYKNEVFLHTGPHHDDIMLGIMPAISRQLRDITNQLHFAIMTSGFTAVTNGFIISALEDTLSFIGQGMIQMIEYPDFFSAGYKYKWDKDVYHYLSKVAEGEEFERRRGLCHRIVRSMVDILGIRDRERLVAEIERMIDKLRSSYDGEKNPPDIQQLKGMLREFEEELVWAHFGVQVRNVHHLRLGFYTGDIFTESPERQRDVAPILELLKQIRPTVISAALDPEGSGPDTHYKVLQAIAQAIREWRTVEDLSKLRIWGYRNVWYRFHPAEVNLFVPVSLNALSLLQSAFTNCYLSQVDAPFPSYQLDGNFSELAGKIWVGQLRDIQLILGKNFFYENQRPLIRATHGMVYIREMTVDEFLDQARELERSMENNTT